MSLYNFTIQQGATCHFTVNYTDSDGAAVDLAGHEAALQIKNAHYSDGGNAILNASSSIGDTYLTNQNLTGSAFISVSGSYPFTSAVASGSIGVYFGYASTHELAPGTYYYDLELTNTATYERVRLLEGKVKVDKSVTTLEPVV